MARDDWHEASTPHFVVLTDGDPDKARDLARDLERFHHVMLQKSNVPAREATPPLRVFLTDDWSFYHRLGGPKHSAGMFVATTAGNYALVTDFRVEANPNAPHARQILFHEYTHYLQSLRGSREPSWYAEGLAEYVGAIEFREGGAYTMGCPPRYRTASRLYMRWRYMDTIMQAESISELRGFGQDAYSQAWYAVHYFLADEERAKQLATYLSQWNSGRPFAEVVQSAFGMSPAQPNDVLEDYSQQKTFDCVEIIPAQPLPEPDVEFRAVPSPRAQLYVAELLLAIGGSKDVAFDLLEQAVSSSPQDGRIRAALARAHLGRAERQLKAAQASEERETDEARSAEQALAAALREAGAALRSMPEDAHVLTATGHVHRLRAAMLVRRDDAAAHEALREARNAYRRAIKHDDTLVEAYYGLGTSYLIDDNGSDEPVVVLEAASYLAPLASLPAFQLAQLRVARGQYAEALPPLQHALYWSADPTLSDAAKKLLARVHKHEPAASEPAAGR